MSGAIMVSGVTALVPRPQSERNSDDARISFSRY